MIDETNVICIAARIFDRTRWQPSEEDIDRLARNMLILEQRGLSKLNRRLIDDRKVWDSLAEHNLAIALVAHNPLPIPIEYEPDEIMGRSLKRPPDFVIQRNGITFWVQMKKLSMTERENRQARTIDDIKEAAKTIKTPRFFSCILSPDFDRADVAPLMDLISAAADNAEDHQEFAWTLPSGHEARVAFWGPRVTELEHLTLGVSGDIEVLDLTGESSIQIRRSLENAAGAFEWDTAAHDINLISMEIGRGHHGVMGVGDAVFGDVVFQINNGRGLFWRRQDNGFFNSSTFGSRVAGVMVRRREEHQPICPYRTFLFINDRFRDRVGHIQSVMAVHRVISFDQMLHDEE